MNSVRIYDLLKKRVLVSRGSARSVEGNLRAALDAGTGRATVDFTSVAGIAPSFLDEVFHVVREYASQMGAAETSLVLSHAPPHLESKLRLLAKTHGFALNKGTDDDWVVHATAEGAPQGA